jgi:hypothetical protein
VESDFELAAGGSERYRNRQFQRGKRPEYLHFRCDKTLASGKECKVAVIFTPVDDTIVGNRQPHCRQRDRLTAVGGTVRYGKGAEEEEIGG